MVKVIAFDCDGVILDSVEVKAKAYGKLVENHGAEAMRRLVDYHHCHGGMSRVVKIAWFYKEVLGREVTPAESKVLEDRFAELCLDEVLQAPFVPGAYEFISAFWRQYAFYAVSGTPEPELLDVFERRGLTPYFKGIYGSPTLKPAILRRIIAEEGVAPDQVLMVGDSRADLEAAKTAGTRFLGRGRFDAPWSWAEDLTGLAAYVQALGEADRA